MFGYGTCFDTGDLNFILCKGSEILNALMPFLVALGVVYLVWGVVQSFINDSEEAKKKGKDRIIFGVIGLAVIISIWGLVYILVRTFRTVDVAPNRYDPNFFQDLLPSQPNPSSSDDGTTILQDQGWPG